MGINRRNISPALGWLLLALVAGGGGFWLASTLSGPPVERPVDTGNRPPPTDGKRIANLYFIDPDSQFLVAESRELLISSPAPVDTARAVIEALIDGPRANGTRTLPPETTLRALYITDNGTAVVDLGAGFAEHHPGGILTELYSLYALVNTLVLNVGEIEQVKLLISGRENELLAGHVSLRSPIHANLLLIR